MEKKGETGDDPKLQIGPIFDPNLAKFDFNNPKLEAERKRLNKSINELTDKNIKYYGRYAIVGSAALLFPLGFGVGIAAVASRTKIPSEGLPMAIKALVGGTLLCAATASLITYGVCASLNVWTFEEFNDLARAKIRSFQSTKE